ncbi:MAG TPA: hypothetical protein VGM11_04575 [Acidobacteriaceae bacterium]|jgi:hypothetical protein
MTLLDAPAYNAARARKRRRIIIASLIGVVIIAILVWTFWNWPAEHRVNRFFTALEQQQFEKAYGIWNNDDHWQQHPDRYKTYPYSKFLDDWSLNGEYGKITSYKILYATSSLGNSTLMAVSVNGRKSLLTLGVSHGTIGFTPFSLTPQKGQFGLTYWQVSYQ